MYLPLSLPEPLPMLLFGITGSVKMRKQSVSTYSYCLIVPSTAILLFPHPLLLLSNLSLCRIVTASTDILKSNK